MQRQESGLSQYSNQNYDSYEDQYDMNDLVETEFQTQKPISNQIKILSNGQIFDSLRQIIENLQEMFYQSFDITLEILYFYKWDVEKLKNEFFDDSHQNQIQNHLQKLGLVDNLKRQNSNKSRVCLVCLEDTNQNEIVPELNCYHDKLFCKSCWLGFIQQKCLNDQMPFISCMQDGCCQRLPFSFIQILAKDSEIFDYYQNALGRRFVEHNKNISYCPGVDQYGTQHEVECKCGLVFCFRCKTEIHSPAPCDMVQKWLGEIKKDEQNLKWILINTKTCPFCFKAVERSEGCNYMNCKPPGGCGKNFCYVCSKPWEPDHKDHFKCSVYRQDQDKSDKIEREKTMLQFVNSEGARIKSIERKSQIEKIQKNCFELIQIQYSESQFVINAIGEMIDSRTVLKWYIKSLIALHIICSDTMKIKQQYFKIINQNLRLHVINWQFTQQNCLNTLRNKNLRFTILQFIQIKKHQSKDFPSFDKHLLFQEFKKKKNDIEGAIYYCRTYKENLQKAINRGDI